MKLLIIAIVLYVGQLFLLPFLAAQMLTTLALDSKELIIVLHVIPTALLAGLGAYIYARWARAPLRIASVIMIGILFLCIPGLWYIAQLSLGYFSNPLSTVAALQILIMPFFDAYQKYGWMYFVAQLLVWTPNWAPYMLGPALASFFVRAQSVADVRLLDNISSDEDSGILKL